MENISDGDLFWWMGILHTDCYKYKINGGIKELRLRVGSNSLEMLVKWKRILDKLTQKKHKIHEETCYDKRFGRDRKSFCVRESSRNVLRNLFEKLPSQIGGSFGPYFAGIIDGDGCIQIRKRYFDKGHERLLKIADSTSENLIGLQVLLLREGMPKGYITKYKNHSDLWIYINKEFGVWLRDNVMPHISITSKLQKLAQEASGDRC